MSGSLVVYTRSGRWGPTDPDAVRCQHGGVVNVREERLREKERRNVIFLVDRKL